MNKYAIKTKFLLRNIILFSTLILSSKLLNAESESVSSQVSRKDLRILTVSGTGTERIPSTLSQIQIGVEAQGQTAEEVQNEVSKKSNSVSTFLKSKNVEKLQTTGVNLSPRYRYDNGSQKMIGYQASNRVSFQVPVNNSGMIMDEAVKAGATQIDSVIFSASENEINEARKNALKNANKDATEQAKVVLENLGFSQKEIVSIKINNYESSYPRPVPVSLSEFSKTSDASSSTPIEAGEQSVRAIVTLEISY